MVRQSLLSLADFAEIDYLGPAIYEDTLKRAFGKIYPLQHTLSYTGIVKILFSGAVTGYYRSWSVMSDALNWDAYDLVYLEYSRYGFIAQKAKKHQKKLAVRVHNVERDYFLNRVTEKKSLQNSLRSLIKRCLITRQERLCLHSADCLICLTADDTKRLTDIYPAETTNKKLAVIPVALEEPCFPTTLSTNQIDAAENNPYLLITGSLWFGPNDEGSAWFIKNVWHKLMAENEWISSNLKLIIAGSRPGKVIQALAAGQKNIEVIDSPRDMKPYFENALIYLAPIFSGAGMKVKVAEALSYGLPVIGTSHALTGYKISNRESGYRADYADEFIESLEHYIGLSVEDKRLLKKKAYQLYLNDHCLVESKKSFQKIISDLVQT